jgi:hypothetical protein
MVRVTALALPWFGLGIPLPEGGVLGLEPARETAGASAPVKAWAPRCGDDL